MGMSGVEAGREGKARKQVMDSDLDSCFCLERSEDVWCFLLVRLDVLVSLKLKKGLGCGSLLGVGGSGPAKSGRQSDRVLARKTPTTSTRSTPPQEKISRAGDSRCFINRNFLSVSAFTFHLFSSVQSAFTLLHTAICAIRSDIHKSNCLTRLFQFIYHVQSLR